MPAFAFRYRGPDTRNQWAIARSGGMKCAPRKRTRGWLEKIFYFGQGVKCQNLNGRKPNTQRRVRFVNYRNTGGKWPGFARSDHFAVRWTGGLRIRKTGHYRFGIVSDDGSQLWIDNRYTINNNGLHGWRNREATRHLRSRLHGVRLEMFERGGHAGMLFRYRGPDSGNRWAVVRSSGLRPPRMTGRVGFWEQAYYFKQGSE